MSDYIRRQEAVDAVAFGITIASAFNKETGERTNLFEKENEELQKAIERIRSLSPAVVAPIVYCKDCKHYCRSSMTCHNNHGLRLPYDDDFCSMGEREEKEKMDRVKAIEVLKRQLACERQEGCDDMDCRECPNNVPDEEFVEALAFTISEMEAIGRTVEEGKREHSNDGWIPVTERLPEYGQVVQWCNENGSVFSSAITYKRGDDWAIGKRHRYKRVLAWRPLPEPYREGQT